MWTTQYADVSPNLDPPLPPDVICPERSRWTSNQLRHLTSTVVAGLAVPLLDMLQFVSDQRWWASLALTGGVELWLLSWMPGQGTKPHDHGGASGAFTVLLGQLTEDYRRRDGSIRARSCLAGATFGFGPHWSHQLRNLEALNAASVHAYSPPLRPIREYANLDSWPAR
ncbi:MAG: cysteine dioxygenase [Egibacteraceae bacterium]